MIVEKKHLENFTILYVEGLIKLGAFADQHVELLRGVLVEMTVQEPGVVLCTKNVSVGNLVPAS